MTRFRFRLIALFLLAPLAGGCTLPEKKAEENHKPPAAAAPAWTPPDMSKAVTTPSGLKYVDTVKGTGASPSYGKVVTVHYTGRLSDGTKFDSSVDRGQPFSFIIGTGQVIKGWDEGVMTMKVGGKRTLIIPPQLGYGERGFGNVIPPNSDLLFDVELLDVRGQ